MIADGSRSIRATIWDMGICIIQRLRSGAARLAAETRDTTGTIDELIDKFLEHVQGARDQMH